MLPHGEIFLWRSVLASGTIDVTKQPKRPRDTNQLAKFIVDVATGDAQRESDEPLQDSRGRAGGLKGGTARAAALTPQQRSEAARKAVQARWARKRS
jgi:hypothetical protein